ncbi:MAG: ATP-dependent protease La [Pseudomonadota bacterium]
MSELDPQAVNDILSAQASNGQDIYPLLPLRDVVIFPHLVAPLFVGRPKSIRALELAMEGQKKIVLVTQKASSKDEPSREDLYDIACVAQILQMLKLPDGTVKVLVEGVSRCKILDLIDTEESLNVSCELIDSVNDSNDEIEAIRRTLLTQLDQYVKLNKKISPEVHGSLMAMEDYSRLADNLATHLPIKLEQRQDILETQSGAARLDKLLVILEGEIDVMQAEKRIRGRVKRQMEKSHRDYYLNEQVKAIQKELGEADTQIDLDALEKRIKEAGMSKEANKKAESELKKLKMMSPMSAEATVSRNYLDALVNLPWTKKSKVMKDLPKSEKILDAEHYGLSKVKERIMEYLAVQQRVDKLKAPILCLVGPPGVGKTSLGQSIAKSVNREFARMSLGGVRDEAEIRGHRRTYIGSLPGKILSSLTKVGVRNPLFLLDEVDKIGHDMRGDPASALLEVLDPEQNSTFSDHYMEVDFDLSDVMFVATANTLNIPAPLLDRMEVIRLSGYTEDEKTNIALEHLVPKQIKNNGLHDSEIKITEEAVRAILRHYTREAGVRGLEREISKICRKVVKAVLISNKKKTKTVVVNASNLSEYLGVQRYEYGETKKENQVGQVNGLAWTEVGGDLLSVEVVALPGKGGIRHTGKLGEVMQESVQAALSVVRKRAERLGIAPNFYEKTDLHIHFPEGATPKDGPSAGIAVCTALVSALTDIPVRHDVAMTGEITLRGEVLAIGGLKEKLLAAHRGGVKLVLIPEDNVKDLADIADDIKNKVEIEAVRWIDQVLQKALAHPPKAGSKKSAKSAGTVVEKAQIVSSSRKSARQVVRH